MSSLERLTQRIQSGGVAQSIMTQIELNEPLDPEKTQQALLKTCDEIIALLDQCEDLETGIKCFLTCLQSTQELLIQTQIKARDLTEKCAELSAENRRLKSNIAELMS